MLYFLSIIKAISIFYICFVAALYFLQAYLIFAPYMLSAPKLEETPLKDIAQSITVRAADEKEITSWIIPPQNEKQPIIVFFHGNAIHALYGFERALTFAEAGHGFVLAEYRGFGGNKGVPDERAIYEDSRRLIHEIKESYPDTPLILYGESIGSGVATQLATEFEIKALILEAPFTSVTDVARKHYPFVPVKYLLKHRFENLSKIKNINAPLLIIHGQTDNIIPITHGQTLYEQAHDPKEFKVIESAGHNDLLLHKSTEIALSFISKL